MEASDRPLIADCGCSVDKIDRGACNIYAPGGSLRESCLDGATAEPTRKLISAIQQAVTEAQHRLPPELAARMSTYEPTREGRELAATYVELMVFLDLLCTIETDNGLR